MMLRGLDHVALGVPDLDSGIELMVGTCGMQLLYTNTVTATGQRMAMLEDSDGRKLELIETAREETPRFLHVAFLTDDVDAACEALVADGWQTKREPHDLPRANARTALVSRYGFDLQVIAYKEPLDHVTAAERSAPS
jgi:catechol 2,3-dioxygenase-like lactoylglutathione lyase family enzyme